MTLEIPPFSRRGWLGLLSVAGLATLSGCSASGALNALVPSDNYSLRADVAYGPQARQRLDVYLPLERRTPGPVVVFFYGGSWTNGERASYRFVGEALASRGIAVVVADYRLSPAVKYPVFLQDSAQAMRWTMDHLGELGADPRQVFVMGHSAGAYNAAMLALDTRWLAGTGLSPAQLAGWIGLAGPYDFLPIGNRDVQVAFDWPGTPADSQPMVHASKNSPPALLLAAHGDTTVNPVRNTEALARRLQAAGVLVGLHIYERVNHVTLVAALATPLRGLAPVLDDIEAFVRKPRA
ncbi:MAG: alpha/beta hydrolase [Pseudomonadota bacterium]|uniref:alpha/beta hydrolase n=1 Tax=Polaromonas sp. TaxID=1869339 RepID=UPI0017B8EC71|nr:alpha/beta hydrolase [Polaromonas sp.]MBA3593397.1 alpha/beta hydrolase [Polaromonas sp.]MDQ3272359.1 alpha/beta hydrolase [Pseudomonadota bacterium]